MRVFRPCDDHEEGAGDEEVEVYRGADRARTEAGRDWDADGGNDPPERRVVADALPLEEGLRRAWRRRATSGEATRRREPQAQPAGRGPEPRQAFLQDVLSKSSDAWAAARARRPRSGVPRGQRTAQLPRAGRRPVIGALRVAPACCDNKDSLSQRLGKSRFNC